MRDFGALRHWGPAASLKLAKIFLTLTKVESVRIRESFCESGEGVRPPGKSGKLPGKSGELPGKSGKLPGNPWTAIKFHSERTSGEVAEKLPGKFGELPGKSGDFPEARGSLTPSQRLAKLVSKRNGRVTTGFGARSKSKGRQDPRCAWVKTGRFGILFVLCFLALVEDTVSRCFVYPDLGHRQTPRICPPFCAFPASIRELSPLKCLFLMANARLPNCPGFALPGKMGSIWHFPCALPASIWGHCSQVLVFTST